MNKDKIRRLLENFNPRQWQIEAREATFSEFAHNQSALIVANPGAGKTWFAGSIAAEGLIEEDFDRVVVVSPTKALKKQWLDELWSKFGISLEMDRPRESAGGDFHGVSVTYQGVASSSNDFKEGCVNIGKTLVILDEPHHAGEHKSWGAALNNAFNLDSVKVLMLTGTPWRTDNKAIPFAPYNSKNELLPTYTYGFKQAIRDNVNRAPRFLTFDAEKVSWFDLKTGEHREYETLELVDKTDSNRAYRTALDEPETVERMFTAANNQLTTIRKTDDIKAAGLLITKDLASAEAARTMVELVTGKAPRIVHNDVPSPIKVINEFKNSLDRWIIAVEMISEGIDIKRLRCCVYAHRAKTELFLRQVVGRFTRRYPLTDGVEDFFGYMFMLQNSALMKIAQKIEEEVKVAIKEHQGITQEGGAGGLDIGILGTGLELVEGDGVASGKRIGRQALAYVREIIETNEILKGMDVIQAAHFMQIMGNFDQSMVENVVNAVEQEKKEQSPDKYKSSLRKSYSQIIKKYVRKKYGADAPKTYALETKRFNAQAGFISVEDASIEKLETAIELVKQDLLEYE